MQPIVMSSTCLSNKYSVCPDFFSEAPTDYYSGDLVPACTETAVRPFGKVFLPTLYSLVFIVGFAGVNFCKHVPLIHGHFWISGSEKGYSVSECFYEHNVIVLTSIT